MVKSNKCPTNTEIYGATIQTIRYSVKDEFLTIKFKEAPFNKFFTVSKNYNLTRYEGKAMRDIALNAAESGQHVYTQCRDGDINSIYEYPYGFKAQTKRDPAPQECPPSKDDLYIRYVGFYNERNHLSIAFRRSGYRNQYALSKVYNLTRYEGQALMAIALNAAATHDRVGIRCQNGSDVYTLYEYAPDYYPTTTNLPYKKNASNDSTSCTPGRHRNYIQYIGFNNNTNWAYISFETAGYDGTYMLSRGWSLNTQRGKLLLKIALDALKHRRFVDMECKHESNEASVYALFEVAPRSQAFQGDMGKNFLPGDRLIRTIGYDTSSDQMLISFQQDGGRMHPFYPFRRNHDELLAAVDIALTALNMNVPLNVEIIDNIGVVLVAANASGFSTSDPFFGTNIVYIQAPGTRGTRRLYHPILHLGGVALYYWVAKQVKLNSDQSRTFLMLALAAMRKEIYVGYRTNATNHGDFRDMYSLTLHYIDP